MNLSVVVTCYNKISHLDEFIPHAHEILNYGFELIVIDDGSNDGSSQKLRAELPVRENLILVNLNENLGSAHARNLGIQNSSANYVFFLDIDDSCNLDELNSAVLLLRNTRAHLLVGNLLILPERTLLKMPFETNSFVTTPVSSISTKIALLMGYSRYLYRRDFLMSSGLRFFPERDESDNRNIILDDAFWMLLISSTQAEVTIISSEVILYNYNRPIPSAKSWQNYLDQLILLPLLTVRFLSGYKDSPKFDSKSLQTNTLNWLFRSLGPLGIMGLIRSRAFSFWFFWQLFVLVGFKLTLKSILFRVPNLVIGGLKNSINIRRRFNQVSSKAKLW